MKRLSYALALLLVAGCSQNSVNTALDTACNANGCISLSKFSANLDAALKGQVVGYASTVGSLAIVSTSGSARTAADPPTRAMDTDLPTNIASLSKVITTIGVLQSLAKHNLTIDDKISPYLPSDWTQGLNIDTITFKELLTHKAGFRNTDDQTHCAYAGLQQQIADGVQLSDKTAAQYNNLNFGMFRVLLPYMEGFSDSDPDPATRASALAKFYIDYIQKNVLQPAGVTDADCKAPTGTKKILSYPLPAGAAHGTDFGDWTLQCGSGGWVMTVGDLYNVMLKLNNGNTLLTAVQRQQMDSNCLGWDCSVLPQFDYVGKSGRLTGPNSNAIWLYTYFGIFKGTVPVVVVINSNSPSGLNINTIVDTAFQNAAVPHP